MTQPVNQSMLIAEMETLAKIYVIIQAAAVDSLVRSVSLPVPWDAMYHKCILIADNISVAIYELVEAYNLLKDQP